MNVLSLFDGIACGAVALERAGIKVDRYIAYEIEKNAIAIAKKNYPNIEECGDVFKADFTQYKGEIDLLIGGSPCTFWSVAQKAGKRETTNEGFGWELFSQYIRALKESGAKYYLYENNYSMHPNIRAEITKAFGHEPIYINSSLVSAQHRKRLYWTNIPGACEPQDMGITLQSILEHGTADRDKSLCICRRYAGFQGSQSYLCRRYFGKSMGQAVFEGDRDAIYKMWKANDRFESDDINIRPLTITEVERCQTLPDGYTNVEGIPLAARIEAVGNGWTVNVISHLLKGLTEAHDEAPSEPEKPMAGVRFIESNMVSVGRVMDSEVDENQVCSECGTVLTSNNMVHLLIDNEENTRPVCEHCVPKLENKAKLRHIMGIAGVGSVDELKDWIDEVSDG